MASAWGAAWGSSWGAAWGATAQPAAIAGGGVWLGGRDFWHPRRKKYIEELRAPQQVVKQAVQKMDAVKKSRPAAYTEIGRIAGIYIETLRARQPDDLSSMYEKIDAIRAHQSALKAKILKQKQQEEEDEEDAVFLLMH